MGPEIISAILEGLPTELVGALAGSQIAGRYRRLRAQRELATPDANHDLQKALTDSFWLAILYVVAEHGGRAREPFAGNPAIWDALKTVWTQPSAADERVRLVAAKLYPLIERKLKEGAPPGESVNVEAVYAEVERLFVRVATRVEAVEILA